MKNKYGMEMRCGERERPDGQLMMPYHLKGASGKGYHHYCGNVAVYRVGTAENYEEEYEIPDLNSPRPKWTKEKHQRIQGTILACGKHLEIAKEFWKQHERQPNSHEQPEVERLDGKPMRGKNPPYKRPKDLMESKFGSEFMQKPIKEQAEELERFHRENEHCAQCYKWLPKNYKWLKYRTGANLCSEDCYKKFDKQVKEHQRLAREMEKRLEQIKHEHEHSLKPYLQFLPIQVYGLRKDVEKFLKELPKILKGYGLK